MKPDNVLAFTGLAAVILLGLAVLAAVVLYSPLSGTGHTITVTASGSASQTATMAQFSVAANGTGATAALAVANLSATMAEVNKTLVPYVNGNLSRISTSYFSVQKVTCPNYYYYPATANLTYPTCNATGYVATEGISATLPSYTNASSAVSSLSNIANVYIGNIYSQLSQSQISALREQAVTAAIANATAQADLAAPNGTSVILQNVTISQYSAQPIFFSAAAASNVASQPTLYSGQGTVTVNVQAKFRYG